MQAISRRYVLTVLTATLALSFVDRQILSLLVAPVKRELSLSDVQIGLLHGLAFAFLYMLLGLPFGWLVDRKDRKRIILAGVSFWSVMTATCGLARNFWEFFLSRIGVGVGEASLQPAAYSLLADAYPPEKLSTALSIFSLGAWLGVGSAFLLGGQVAEIAGTVANLSGLNWSGWRLLFLALGAVGVVVCLLVLMIQEPLRRRQTETMPLVETARFLKSRGSLIVPLFLGYSMILLNVYAFLGWSPALLMRIYGWTPAEVGQALGLCALLLCPVGALSGGTIADRLVRRGFAAGPIVIGVVEAALFLPCLLGLAFVTSGTAALCLLAAIFVLGPLALGSGIAAVQLLTPPQFRGQVSAVYLLVTSLLGVAGGPALTAFFTDRVLADELRVDDSLALVGLATLPIAFACLAIASRRFSMFGGSSEA
jgi:MFS family permease